MPLHRETRIVPYSADEMYAVVADMERYPEFLPWCADLKILKRNKEDGIDCVTAEMTAAYQGLRERYVSRVQLDSEALMIEARHVEGPFKRLDSRWRFVPLEKGSEIHFLIDFSFKNLLLSAVANVAFGYVVARMTEASVKRAEALHSKELKQ